MNTSLLEQELNKTQFVGCSGILIGDALHFSLIEKVTLKEGILSFLKLIRNEFAEIYKIKVKGSPKVAFIFSSSYRLRNDFKESFICLAESLENYLLILCENYHIGKPKRTFWLLGKWYRSLGKLENVKLSLTEKLYIISLVQQLYCNNYEIENILKKYQSQIENVISVCDVMPVDSFVMQRVKAKGIKTITLQHGTFNVGHYAYTHCKCDWFLAHSKFSIINAWKSGMKLSRLYPIGTLNNLLKNGLHKDNVKNTIGILLGGSVLTSQDIELVKMVKRYAKKYNKRVIAKLHPAWGIDRYPKGTFHGITRVYSDDINIIEFAKLTDCTVDDGSTVFVEYASMMHPDFTYIHEHSPYKGDEKIHLTFYSYEGMETLFNMESNCDDRLNQMMVENKKYLSTEIGTVELFRKFCRDVLEVN